ncbi:hypothetical protein HOK51_03630 [Candidatus Woesearchaeota archaeon]|jgi:hypothetical protein|nr:hypothetical protein [Candidatus Woesearchaeota archaeon]MBT6518912.1 hypothetical protein [Candidatus Woesearchaeota archaeon]MBT7367580.1 hypothetical protein [Candidatus Woesearchaeota archaeon]
MKWIKRIFSKIKDAHVPEISDEEEFVEAAQLSNWFERKTEHKFDDLKTEVETSFSKIDETTDSMRDNLDLLNSSELQNPNIPERAVQIMEGNRDSFISQHKIFLDGMSIPQNPDFKSTLIFCERYFVALERLGKSTGKSTAVLNEFFSNEVSAINQNISKINNILGSLKNKLMSEEKGIEYVDEIKQDVEEFNGKLKRESELLQDKDFHKQKLDASIGMKKKLEKDVDKLKASEGYSAYSSLDTERDSLKKEIKQVENDIFHVFFQLDKVFKKYVRISVDNARLIQQYLDDPVTAVVADEENKILDVSAKMILAIDQGTIDLKDGSKVIERISRINKDFLDRFRFKHNDLKNSTKKLDFKMKNSRVMQEISDLNYKMDHVNKQIQILEEKNSKFDKSIERLDIDQARRNLQIKLQKALGFRVTVNK